MIDLKPLAVELKGKPVAIVGLGKSGLATFEACRAAGIDTVLWDDNPKSVAEAQKAGAKTTDLGAADMSGFALLCLAPGIPLTHPKPHPVVLRAREAGVEIVSDIELLHRAHPDIKTVGITGTNGKSTTTALVGHILKTAGVESAVGGNIGEASLTLPQLSKNGIYVLELSSYQLDLCPRFAPDIAALINIAPDHLDRHGGMEGYIAAKKRIFRKEKTAIIGIDDDGARRVHAALQKTASKVIPVSVGKETQGGVFVTEEGFLRDGGKDIFDLKKCPHLKGRHNWQNAGFAYAIAKEAGVPLEKIIAGLESFPGLAHRQNIVAVEGGVTYINDSKATNDQAAAMALKTYKPIYWIAGGRPKDGGYAECERHLSHVHHALLIGEAQAGMAEWLENNGVSVTFCGTLQKALMIAHQMARLEKLTGAVILLSPACASFDQFKNFEERGDTFAALVKDLLATEKRAAG